MCNRIMVKLRPKQALYRFRRFIDSDHLRCTNRMTFMQINILVISFSLVIHWITFLFCSCISLWYKDLVYVRISQMLFCTRQLHDVCAKVTSLWNNSTVFVIKISGGVCNIITILYSVPILCVSHVCLFVECGSIYPPEWPETLPIITEGRYDTPPFLPLPCKDTLFPCSTSSPFSVEQNTSSKNFIPKFCPNSSPENWTNYL